MCRFRNATIALILIGALLLPNVAFATQGETKGAQTTRLEDNREKMEARRSLNLEINNNSVIILELRVEAKTALTSMRNKVKDLRVRLDTLSGEEIQVLRDAIPMLRNSTEALGINIGKIHTEVLALRRARLEKNDAVIEQSLKNIISIQKSRIENLEEAIDKMNEFLNQLTADVL